MGYSRSCPRTQAASTRHVSDLTPRSDSRPHQPGLPPKRLSTVGTCSIAAAPCRRNPRQHSTESLFSAQSLPFRSASRSSRKDTGLQPVLPAALRRRCSLLYSISAAPCCYNPRQQPTGIFSVAISNILAVMCGAATIRSQPRQCPCQVSSFLLLATSINHR